MFLYQIFCFVFFSGEPIFKFDHYVIGGHHQGSCPPIRPSCPPTRFHGGPKTCAGDFGCGYSEKCCYDTCLAKRVCKTAQR